MGKDHQDVDFGYEYALRVIGRHLDAEPAYHTRILQVDDGFLVRYCPTRHQADELTMHFTRQRIQDLGVWQLSGRGMGARKHRHEGIWARFGEPHEEFLRSLGHLLDTAQAHGLTLDEFDGEVQVSFLRPCLDDPLQTDKEHLTFHEDDIVALVEAARRRRARHLHIITP